MFYFLKACKDSCEIYEEFQVKQKQIFKIGQLHGASVIMVILFAIFLVLFLRLACLSFRHEKRKASKKLGSDDQSKRPIECRIIQRLFRCCGLCRRSKRTHEASNIDSPDSRPEDHRSLFDKCLLRIGIKKNISQRLPQEDSPFDGNSPQPPSTDETAATKADMRLSELNLLDKMRYVGEKLESFIEDRFFKMGKFCTKYPKLVLFLGLVFCALMCLGYFNFKIEKDPIKLWSADSSVARKNKKYFDENFGPFYRITQLIVEPKTHVKPFLFGEPEDGVYNITALRPEILLEVYK